MTLTRVRWLAVAARRYCTAAPGTRFSQQHEWVRRDVAAGDAVVGVSHFAQEALGEVVFAQLPTVGTALKRGDQCGALESVKAASELYSPVSGTVTAANSTVEATPSLINSSCYNDGWLFRLKLSDEKEFDSLMSESEYAEFVKKDEH